MTSKTKHSAESSPRAVGDQTPPRPRPLYFGPADRPIFGWAHEPATPAPSSRVVFCPPLGYEGLFAHPTLRALALRLARDGSAVLRFDYDGTGDSAGSDRDPNRVDSWVQSIVLAAEETRRLWSDGVPLTLVAMRAGTLLATRAAERLDHVDGLVLWAPVSRGRSFVREQKAFAGMAVATAGSREGEGKPEGGIEAYGYFYSDETVGDLGALDLRSKDLPAERGLILWRDDIEDRREDLAHWARLERVTESQATGYAAMMEPPISMELPEEAMSRICSFVGEGRTGGFTPGTKTDDRRPPTRGRTGPGVIEEAVWYDETAGLFGILTLPEHGSPAHALVLLNNARGYRVGPHAMNPPLARRLAENGVATLRLDLAGVGDSLLPPDRSEHHVYGLDSVADVRSAVEYLGDRGIPRIHLGGLCSGAFLAWHAASEIPDIAGLVLLNLQIFEWEEGISLDVSPLDLQYETDHYRQSMRSSAKWKKLLSGQVDVGHLVGVARRSLGYRIHTQSQRIRALLPFGGTGSAVGNALEAFHQAGTRVTFIFADRDPGLTNLREEIGGAWQGMVSGKRMEVHLVEGSDHSFTPGWASRELYELVEGAISG